MKQLGLQTRGKTWNENVNGIHNWIKKPNAKRPHLLLLSLRGVVWVGQQNIYITTRCSTCKLSINQMSIRILVYYSANERQSYVFPVFICLFVQIGRAHV